MTEAYHTTEQNVPTREERAIMREQMLGEKASKALAFQTAAVRHFGADAGIFLRQLLYRDGSGADGDFWIYKSYAEWEEETGLQRRGQERARKRLLGAGAIEEKKAVVHGRRTLHFRVDSRKVMEILGDDLPHAKPSSRSRDCTVNRTVSLSTADNDLAYSRQGITEDYTEDYSEEPHPTISSFQSEIVRPSQEDRATSQNQKATPTAVGGVAPGADSSLPGQPTPQEDQRGEAVNDTSPRKRDASSSEGLIYEADGQTLDVMAMFKEEKARLRNSAHA